jgi:hypothetical protein
MSELDQLAPSGIVQLNDAPAGLDDATWDSLFPTEPQAFAPNQPAQQATQPVGTQTQSQQQPASQQPPVSQQPAATQPFIKGEKSVYNSMESAVDGINKKDATIDELRQRYALVTGIDPLTGRAVGIAAQQNVAKDYNADPKAYLDDLYQASQSGDPSKYTAVQQKLINDTLAPVRPIIAQTVKTQAVQAVSQENADAGKFIGTPAYNKTLEANPDLQNAIATAEATPQFYSRLPGLYKLAHLAGQGMQLPELLRAATPAPTQTQNAQPVQVRTTAQPTTLSPAQQTAKPSLRSIEGIRSTIADMEAKGVSLEF